MGSRIQGLGLKLDGAAKREALRDISHEAPPSTLKHHRDRDMCGQQ